MSSSDDEAQSPNLGASSSKDPPPPLDAESSDELEDVDLLRAIVKSKKSYKRPSIEWREVLSLSSGADGTMREDEMKLQITEAYNQFMEDSQKIQLPGHMPAPTDVGLWKLKSEYMVDIT